METTEFVNVFQSLAYPVAVSAILFFAIWCFGKQMLADIRERDKQAVTTNEKYIAYLQMSNVELTAALKENATASKENAMALKETAQALNRFSLILERIEDKLEIKKEQK